MQTQTVAWFQLLLVVLGVVLRVYTGQKRNYINRINSSIGSLRDEARHEMLLVLGQFFHDVESQEEMRSGMTPDGGRNGASSDDDPIEISNNVFEKWVNNPTVEDEVKLAIMRVARTVQEKAEAGDPKEQSLKQLQEIRRDMQPGADLEEVQCYKRFTEFAEKYLQLSLNSAILFSVGMLAALILSDLVSAVPVPNPITSRLITYGLILGVIPLIVAVVMTFVSQYYRSKAKAVFDRNGIDADEIGGFL